MPLVSSSRLRDLYRRWLARTRQGSPAPEVGAIFHRLRVPGVVETARVLAVTNDPAGIAHVRIEIVVQGPHYARSLEGQRLLSVSAFADYFGEGAPPPAASHEPAMAAE